VPPAHVERAVKDIADAHHQHLLLRRIERALARFGGRDR